MTTDAALMTDDGDTVFAVCAGPRADRGRCIGCQEPAGAHSWAMAHRSPVRGIFCATCFTLLLAQVRERAARQ